MVALQSETVAKRYEKKHQIRQDMQKLLTTSRVVRGWLTAVDRIDSEVAENATTSGIN